MGDKLKVIAFTGGGYSLLPANKYMIGYMNPDGTVNWEKLNILLQRISNAGAWGWREFPPWPTNQEAPISFQFLKPFYSVEGQIVWNMLYFENLAKIFRFAHEVYNLIPIFDLFNGSETRVLGEYKTKEYSPWATFKDYFYGDDSIETRHQWIDRIIDAAGDIPVWYQSCNEPGTAVRHRAENMLVDTFDYLLKKNIPLNRIIIGLDGFRKKKVARYREIYNAWKAQTIPIIRAHLDLHTTSIDDINRKYIKGTMVTPIHGMKNDTVSDYFAHGLAPGQDPPTGSGRNTIYSTDAVNPRLTNLQSRNLALKIINVKSDAIEAGRVMIESVIGKEADLKDPFSCLWGITQLIASKIREPENYGKFPKPLPIPSWVYDSPEKPEPEPKSITILSPNSYDTISVDANNRNLTIGITWKFTGDIKYVNIRHRSDGAYWTMIASKEKNDSAYEWKSANLKDGKNWIAIDGHDGETMATQEFKVEFRWPEEEKMTVWQWLKKWHRCLIGVPIILGTVIAVAIKWWLVVPGLLLNHGLWHFRIFKK